MKTEKTYSTIFKANNAYEENMQNRNIGQNAMANSIIMVSKTKFSTHVIINYNITIRRNTLDRLQQDS
jgi:hypothetical protein